MTSCLDKADEEGPIAQKDNGTWGAFVNNDNFDRKKSLEAVIDTRKFLMKRIFKDTRSSAHRKIVTVNEKL